MRLGSNAILAQKQALEAQKLQFEAEGHALERAKLKTLAMECVANPLGEDAAGGVFARRITLTTLFRRPLQHRVPLVPERLLLQMSSILWYGTQEASPAPTCPL